MKTKKLRMGFIAVSLLCVFGCCSVWLLGTFARHKAGPGTDMEAIKVHLSRYSNDYEEHAQIRNLMVLDQHPDFHKPEPWYAFMEKVRAGETAWVTMVSYTIEGDSIFYYLNFDGTEFLYVWDTTRDRYGNHGYWEDKFTKLYEFTEENEAGKERYYVVLSNTELTSLEDAESLYWETYAEWEAGTYDPDTAEYQRFPSYIISMTR